ncbi:MAG: restriction endonuclease, SacI family [Pyrinomonadaceae bacterium]
MPSLDYRQATTLLEDLFAEAEAAYLNNDPPTGGQVAVPLATLFASATQSYREALLGCGLARLLDRSINIRRIYINQGADAFNGRTLDERVVNPFLHDHMVPSSRGPYLAVFRRNVELRPETGAGLRDKAGYAAVLDVVDALETAEPDNARAIVLCLLYGFVAMRETATISLARISRLSLEQYDALIANLLQVQSRGLIPVLLVVAMLHTIKACYSLTWDIEWHGINVADRASGAGGDITVKKGRNILLAIEITERPIDRARIVSTFTTKIVRGGIEDYLFVYGSALPSEEARQAARTYFSQGHEINFLEVREWIVNNLATLGARCRSLFTRQILTLFETPEVPAKVKVAWNDSLRAVVGT